MVKERVNKKFLAKFMWVLREENEQADRLVKAVSAEHMAISNQVLSFIQYSPVTVDVDIQVIPTRVNWMASIISFFKNGTLLEVHNASRRLKVQASHFILMGDVFYKRGFSRPYLRCLVPDKVSYVIREVHEEVCGNHSGARSLVHKLIRAGYYWPTMQKDA